LEGGVDYSFYRWRGRDESLIPDN